jgi:hypothetical protein
VVVATTGLELVVEDLAGQPPLEVVVVATTGAELLLQSFQSARAVPARAARTVAVVYCIISVLRFVWVLKND